MARPIWRGSLAFGLVNIPVGLYAATSDRRPHFHQFQRGTSDRVRNKRVNERTGEEVAYEDLVKGAEVPDGYAIIEPDELAAIAPGRSRLIEIVEFVDGAEIDPAYYRRTYYLAPDGEAAEKSYGLLRDALVETGRVAIGSFVMRGQQYVAALRGGHDAMVLETLYYADEVRSPVEELPSLPEAGRSPRKEREMATRLIDSMVAEWDPTEFTDTYRERVEDLVERKRKGEQVVAEGEPPESTNVVDLMDALQRSVESAKRGRGDLSELSKKELSEMARDLDIGGRSKMSRDDLERAVADARGTEQRKAS